MIHQPKSESVVEELHRIRRAISDKFDGDVAAIAQDAAVRLLRSGRLVWKSCSETKMSQGTGGAEKPADPAAVVGP